MDKKYLQGKASLLSVNVGCRLYKISNGNELRICDMCDDPEYQYGYDYFDGKTKKLIDGGVFNYDAGTVQEVLEEAMGWCDLDPGVFTAELITDEEAEYGDLEAKGYTGF